MYEYIHSKNNRINDELDYIKESSQRNDLLNRLKDEDILLCIPCIKEYIDKKLNSFNEPHNKYKIITGED